MCAQGYQLHFESFSRINAPMDFMIVSKADDPRASTVEIGCQLLEMCKGTALFRTALDTMQTGKTSTLAEIVQPYEVQRAVASAV